MAYKNVNVTAFGEKVIEIKQRKKDVKNSEKIMSEFATGIITNNLNGLQIFFIKYFGLKVEECSKLRIGIGNSDKILTGKSELSREDLEDIRYNELINFLFMLFKDAVIKFSNENKDRFHNKVMSINDYTESFIEEPLLIKKMRNLQLLNILAHKFNGEFYSLSNMMISEHLRLDEEKKKIIANHEYIKLLFSPISQDVTYAERGLREIVGSEVIYDIKSNPVLQTYIDLKKWMFRQKNEYMFEILSDLERTNGEYNYGKELTEIDGKRLMAYIFDVPGYGQFSVHRTKRETRFDALDSNVPYYKDTFLGKSGLLYKADKKLIKNVNMNELSDREKKIYKIVTQQIKDDKLTLKNLLRNATDQEKANKIVQNIKSFGLEPIDFVTSTLLEKGDPDAVSEILKIFLDEKMNLGVNLLKKCKTILTFDIEKAIDVLQIVDEVTRLGISTSIFEENPSFLITAKSEKIEPIYNILKEYNVMLTNYNIAAALTGTPDNIIKNMDWAIENGVYDIAQAGVNKLFTTNNRKLNLKANLLLQQNESLVHTNKGNGRRKLNPAFIMTEKELLKKYGITKKEIIDELSKIRGQELLNGSKYNVELGRNKEDLTKEQKQISKDIFERLNAYQSEDGIIMKIGDYYYSVHKVKDQIKQIISSLEIESLKNESIYEILKIALLKNKNIDAKEVEFVSKQLELMRREEVAEKNKEKYGETRSTSLELSDEKQSFIEIKRKISDLKVQRQELKTKIKENEEKLSKILAENEQPTEEVIRSIKELQKIIEEQKRERDEIKELKESYKEEKRNTKKTIKEEKRKLKNQVDDLEL